MIRDRSTRAAQMAGALGNASLPRNPRPHKAYGFSPVEQIVMTVNIALRRQGMSCSTSPRATSRPAC